MITIDTLCYASKLRFVSGGTKFALAVITLILCVMGRSISSALFVLFSMSLLTVYAGGLKWKRYLHFLTIPAAFLILSTLTVVFNYRQKPLDIFALPLGSGYITVGTNSLLYGVQLMLTALAAVSCLYFLSLNTPMPDILEVLRFLHLPRIFIELMMLIYRFIFLLLEISLNISNAQNSRLGNRDYKTSVKSFTSLGSVLFIRAFKKANALYDAMEARCYDGTIHVLRESNPPKKSHILVVLLYELLLLLIIWKGGV